MTVSSPQVARQSMRAAALLLTLVLIAGAPLTLVAEPPAQQQTQVPGFYRMVLGEFEVTALYDGSIELSPALLNGISEEGLQSLLARMFHVEDGGVQTAVNGYVVHTGTNLVLVDAGAAACFGPALGKLEDNLRAAGYRPEQIDTVLLTHLHPDHSCGLVDGQGNAAYPNAQVYVSEPEAGFWLSEEVAARMPEESHAFFRMAREAVAPYAQAGRFATYQVGEALLPGLEVVPSPGHTPGHVSYLFNSKDQNLLVWGDIVHNHAVQFPHPEVSIDFDVDAPQAVATRKKMLADAALDKLWIAGAHLPFPGIGHVRAETAGYAWVPVEFGPLPQ